MILLYNATAMADCYYDEDDDGMCLVETFAPFCDHRNHALWPQPSRAPTKSWTQETRKTETQLSVAWHRTITETWWLQTFQAKESPSCRSSNTLISCNFLQLNLPQIWMFFFYMKTEKGTQTYTNTVRYKWWLKPRQKIRSSVRVCALEREGAAGSFDFPRVAAHNVLWRNIPTLSTNKAQNLNAQDILWKHKSGYHGSQSHEATYCGSSGKNRQSFMRCCLLWSTAAHKHHQYCQNQIWSNQEK